ncbi:MAG: NTE family protein [Granulosicoccus sp.]
MSLASNIEDFHTSVDVLGQVWQGLTMDHVFRTGACDLIGGVCRFGRSFFHEGVDYHRPLSLLDNSPLNAFLSKSIDFSNIQKNIDSGVLRAVSVAALGYSSSNSVNFFQGSNELEEWERFRRMGRATTIGMEHLLASSAIPWIFPTVRIGQEYFGDGAMRQIAPISPVLHLGADRIFIIGVSGNRQAYTKRYRPRSRHPPSMAQMAGHLLNSAFVDSLESDIEHLERVNELVALVPEKDKEATSLKPVETLIISPSKAIDKIAGRHVRNLPKTLRFFMRSSGATARRGGSVLSSYLLFVKPFIDELVELGYQDAMWEKDSIEAFFTDEN